MLRGISASKRGAYELDENELIIIIIDTDTWLHTRNNTLFAYCLYYWIVPKHIILDIRILLHKSQHMSWMKTCSQFPCWSWYHFCLTKEQNLFIRYAFHHNIMFPRVWIVVINSGYWISKYGRGWHDGWRRPWTWWAQSQAEEKKRRWSWGVTRDGKY